MADMNGDGNGDILFQNNAGQVAVWHMDGSGGVLSYAFIYNASLDDRRAH